MNYIKQLNAFYDWLLINPLSPKEQALYLAILHLNNKAGWKREFTIANQTLQAMCSMSKSELHKIRNKLEQKGLIEYKKGKRGKAGRYKISFLYETNTETNMETNQETNMETNIDTNVETNMEDINKQKLNKTKQKEDDDISSDHFKRVVQLFEQSGMGTINEIIAESLQHISKNYSYELIKEAFRIARLNHASSIRYVEKILFAWAEKGIKSISQLEMYKANRRRNEYGIAKDYSRKGNQETDQYAGIGLTLEDLS